MVDGTALAAAPDGAVHGVRTVVSAAILGSVKAVGDEKRSFGAELGQETGLAKRALDELRWLIGEGVAADRVLVSNPETHFDGAGCMKEKGLVLAERCSGKCGIWRFGSGPGKIPLLKDFAHDVMTFSS